MSEKDKPIDVRHPGSVAAEDEELTLWLNQLWARTEPPERLELWQMFGRARGELIHHVDFPPGKNLDIEQSNKLANEVMAAAQNDCDSATKESRYQLAIVDRNRKSSPLTRRIGPLQPKRTYAVAKHGEDFGDDETEALDSKAINFKYAKENLDQAKWDKDRYDRVMGQMLILQDNTIRNQQQVIDRLFAQQISFFDKLQDSQDRSLDRELIREREKFKIGLWKDGMRTARNILPGLFNGATAAIESNGSAHNNIHGAQTASQNIGSSSAPKTVRSAESILIENFLHDCEESNITIVLFGDFEQKDGELVQVKPGIFSFDQLKILLKVQNGNLPPTALDDLMPSSGHANAITQEQIVKAQEAGVTEGIGMALMEIVGLRQRAKEARDAVANTPPSAPNNEVQQ